VVERNKEGCAQRARRALQLLLFVMVAGLADPVAMRGQAQPARPEFEVASVKPWEATDSGPRPAQRQENVDGMIMSAYRAHVPMVGQRVKMGRLPLIDLIALACRVAPRDVVGPAWMREARFEIEAKAPDGARDEEFYGMLLSLLEDRFNLRWHRESKTGRGYELALDNKGPRLTESQPPDKDAKPGAGPNLRGMQFFPGAMGRGHISASQLCEWFADILHAPVTDGTGLTGKYDVTLAAPRDRMERESGTWLLTAVEDLGLRLTPLKVPIEEIVVDSVEKTPKPN
jgi:uncharacterized protein (TIGR03435 family)